jgi:hypothetical protein
MWYSKNFSINFHSISISMWHNNNFSINFHSSSLSNQMYLCISISIKCIYLYGNNFFP